MTAQLDSIVHDIRVATARDAARDARRRQRSVRTLAAVSATLALSTGAAAATGNLHALGDLLDRDAAGVEITPSGGGGHEVVLDLFAQLGAGQMRGAITDLGTTKRAAPAPDAAVCTTDGAGGLGCGGAVDGTAAAMPATVIPAGTHVYRVEPEGATGSEHHVVYIPDRRVQLVIVGEAPVPSASAARRSVTP